jgi:hypothetical protein
MVVAVGHLVFYFFSYLGADQDDYDPTFVYSTKVGGKPNVERDFFHALWPSTNSICRGQLGSGSEAARWTRISAGCVLRKPGQEGSMTQFENIRTFDGVLRLVGDTLEAVVPAEAFDLLPEPDDWAPSPRIPPRALEAPDRARDTR